MGELIGKTVTKAVKAALSKQSGLNPRTQHNVFRRLKTFSSNNAKYLAFIPAAVSCLKA